MSSSPSKTGAQIVVESLEKHGVKYVFGIPGAKAVVDSLPFAAGGFLKFEFVPVGPLSPLGLLLQGK